MFIKSIKFPEGHPFYNKGKVIEFGDEQRDLIDFYLKTTKKIKEGEKDIGFGNNIQINCILGDNGTGKSRFIQEIYNYFRWGDSEQITGRLLSFSTRNGEKIKAFNGDGDAQYGPSWHSNLKNYQLGESPFSIIFDDFFVLSSNREKSIHKRLLQSDGWNNFYCDTYNFLQKKATNKLIFSSFLGLKSNYTINLDITLKEGLFDGLLNDNTREETLVNLDEDEYLRLFELFKNILEGNKMDGMDNLEEILNVDRENIKHIWIYYSYIFLATVDKIWDSISFDDSFSKSQVSESIKTDEYKKFKKTLNLLDYFLGLFTLETIRELANFEEEQYLSIHSDIVIIKENLRLFIRCLDSMELNGEHSEEFSTEIREFMQNSHTERGNFSGNFIDKLQKSKYSSQDDSLWKSLLFNFSDPSTYNYESVADYRRELISKEEKSNRRSRIAYLLAYFNTHSSFVEKNNSYSIKTNLPLKPKEIRILSNTIFRLDLCFLEERLFIKSFNSLSGGEKTMLARFSTTYREVTQGYNSDKKKNFIVLIDEPDLHLHLDWQRQYIQRLIDVFSTIPYPDISLHFIIATHSPFIVSDLPGENIIRMKKDGIVTFQNYGEGEEDKKTSFGANYVDIIQEGFFDNQLLMGSFAEEIINNLAMAEKIDILGKNFRSTKDSEKVEQYLNNPENREKVVAMKNEIGDEFIKNHLLYF